MARIANSTEMSADHLGNQTAPADTSRTRTCSLEEIHASGRRSPAGTAVPESVAAQERDPEPDRRNNLDADTGDDHLNRGSFAVHADDTDELELEDEMSSDDRPDDEADVTAVAVMRRFWDREIASGRVPSGASGARLSRAAGVPPTTGLGRRKRREWTAELSEPLKTAAGAGK